MDPALEVEIAGLLRQKAMNEALKQGDSDVQKFYANTTIFITGGTGFLGKHLIEKLLRSCQISKIYLLIRSKKGKTVNKRLEEMLEDPVFSSLHKSQPGFLSRFVCVDGDASDIRLGLSERDWQMLAEEVDVIFHCAATTRFDEKLRTAARINVRGTREALLLARATERLKSFIHVSTAYCHATTDRIGQEVQESFYPTPISPETLMNIVEEVDEQRLDALTPELIKNWPNTYTYCKAVGEETVRTMSEGLPISIVRPGIVIASYTEPSPGWTDKSTIYGVTGLLFGIGLGVLHVVYNDPKNKVALIPCDYVTNAVIVAGRETSCKQRKGGNDTPIFTISSVARNSVSWEMMSYILNNDCFRQLPSPMALYYNYALETGNLLMFKILFWFVHIIPAYFLDALCFVLRKDRIFVKLSNKAKKMAMFFTYFSINHWLFLDNNTDKLYTNLSKKDQIIFNFDIPNINWTEFTMTWCIGVRKYILDDDLKSTAKGVRKQFWLRFLHYFLSCVYFYVLWQVIRLSYYVCKSLLSIVI